MYSPRGKSTSPGNESEAKSGKRCTEKVFLVRNSYFTTLFQNDMNLRSVYHLFVVIFILLLLDSVSHDLLTSGRAYFGLQTIKQGFGRIHLALAVCFLMHMSVIGQYYALQAWAQGLRNIKNSTYLQLQTFFNYCCVMNFAGFLITLLYVGVITCLKNDLPFASAAALLLETLRLIMKAHAFVRTNAPKFKDDTFRLAPISSYLYYLYAPTFIYRDSYPRTNQIRWTFAMRNLLEVVSIVFLYSFIHEGHILSNFQDFGVKNLSMIEVVDKVFAMILPSTLILLTMGYLILHCWLNFTGEVLRFADRMYYKDWWTSANYEDYYRSWNVVVHEWFHEYIYKDTYRYIFKGSKLWSSLVVFYLSAILHEIVLGIALQMFYPVMFVFFGGSGVLFFYTTKKLPKTLGKVFFWFTMLTGSTFIVCLYAMEFFARRNCTEFDREGWFPASWSLIALIHS